MKRERVIKEIEDIDQAMKAEDTVKTGYIDLLTDYLTNWIAVEEDLSESYSKLAKKQTQTNTKKTLETLASESKENGRTLKKLLIEFEDLAEARTSRSKKLQQIQKT